MPSLQLSSLDKSAPRSYIRYALVFRCESEESAAAAERLHRAVAKTVSELPVLAGTVEAEKGQALEVSTSVAEIARSAAILTWSQEAGLSLRALADEEIPPGLLHAEIPSPLLDDAENGTSPVFVAQGNFIQDGLVLVLYLHRSVADIKGIASILRAMCEDLPTRRQTAEELAEEVKEASLSRSRLAAGVGAPAFLAQARQIYRLQQHQEQQAAGAPATATNALAQATRAAIISFDLEKLQTIKDCINVRRYMRRSGSNEPPLTTDDVLLSVVWRMVTRAKYPSTSDYPIGVTTSISIPIDVRRIMTPPLEADYLGNATISAFADHEVDMLSMYYDISNIERTATIISAARTHAATDLLVRAEVNALNEGTAEVATEADLKITDWSKTIPELYFNDLDLGLGLGEAICCRKMDKDIESNECVVLPIRAEDWEVQIGMEGGVMERILEDEMLRSLVFFIAC